MVSSPGADGISRKVKKYVDLSAAQKYVIAAQSRYSTRLVMLAEMFNCGMAVSSREQLRCI